MQTVESSRTTLRAVGKNEEWLHAWILEKPSRLGLGDVTIKLLRSVALLASTSAGRLGVLVRALDARVPRAVFDAAPAGAEAVDALEEYLRENWDRLAEEQCRRQPEYQTDDLLWRAVAGWGKCAEVGSLGRNLEVYLHRRAENRKVRSDFFLNVAEAAKWDEGVSTRLGAIESLATR